GYRSIAAITGSNGIAPLGSIARGAMVYGIMLLLTGSLTRDELLAIPGIGRPAVRMLNKVGLMKEKK
ncbi:MAG: polysaccharide biosynthesis protein, partial [Bacillota bacterium]